MLTTCYSSRSTLTPARLALPLRFASPGNTFYGISVAFLCVAHCTSSVMICYFGSVNGGGVYKARANRSALGSP